MKMIEDNLIFPFNDKNVTNYLVNRWSNPHFDFELYIFIYFYKRLLISSSFFSSGIDTANWRVVLVYDLRHESHDIKVR